MLRSRNLAVLVAIVATCGAALAGCSSSNSSGGSATTTTVANKGFDIATPEGSASLSLNGNLPADWPSTFPVPPDATPAGSGSLVNSSTDVMIGVYTVSGTPQTTYDFYRASTDLDVTRAKNLGVGSAFIGRVQFSGTYNGSVTVSGRDATTYVIIVLRNSATSGSATTSTTAAA